MGGDSLLFCEHATLSLPSPLQIVADQLGNLMNKTAVLSFLLEGKPMEAFSHLKRMKKVSPMSSPSSLPSPLILSTTEGEVLRAWEKLWALRGLISIPSLAAFLLHPLCSPLLQDVVELHLTPLPESVSGAATDALSFRSVAARGLFVCPLSRVEANGGHS